MRSSKPEREFEVVQVEEDMEYASLAGEEVEALSEVLGEEESRAVKGVEGRVTRHQERGGRKGRRKEGMKGGREEGREVGQRDKLWNWRLAVLEV